MNDLYDEELEAIVDNNDKFRDFSIYPDFSLNDDPEDEDISDCNLLKYGFHIITTEIDEEEPTSLVEEKGHKFTLKTIRNQ